MTRIKVTIDDNELYECLCTDFQGGAFVFQHHDSGSKVSIRKVRFMPLAKSLDRTLDASDRITATAEFHKKLRRVRDLIVLRAVEINRA